PGTAFDDVAHGELQEAAQRSRWTLIHEHCRETRRRRLHPGEPAVYKRKMFIRRLARIELHQHPEPFFAIFRLNGANLHALSPTSSLAFHAREGQVILNP